MSEYSLVLILRDRALTVTVEAETQDEAVCDLAFFVEDDAFIASALTPLNMARLAVLRARVNDTRAAFEEAVSAVQVEEARQAGTLEA